jgi:DNA-binding NarL/FixJ family response regulator
MSIGQSKSLGRVRVLIADPDYKRSQLMARALTRRGKEFEIAGIVRDSQDLIHQVEIFNADVTVLGVGLQDGTQSVLAPLRMLRDSHARTAPVMLLRSADQAIVVEAFRTGARGIISPTESFKLLAKCIRCVHDGQCWVNNSQLEYLLQAVVEQTGSDQAHGMALLTPREQLFTKLATERGKRPPTTAPGAPDSLCRAKAWGASRKRRKYYYPGLKWRDESALE